MMSSSKIKFLTLILLAVVGLSFGTIWVFKLVTEDKPPSEVREPKRPQAEIEATCRQHVREAYQEASKAITRRAAEFADFITSHKSGVKPFSKALVSPSGKWRTIKPYLPLTDKDGHKEYVGEKFEQHIFTDQALAAAFKRAIEGGVKDIESIENALAVTLGREISGQPLSPDEVPIAAEAFKKAEESMVAASQRDVAQSAARLVVTEVATIVLARLGVSAGALAVGAANSLWSLGTTLVIGVVVDQIWEWVDDPAEDIEREMIDTLDELSQKASTAIEEEMNKKILQRRELWNKAVMEILS